MRNKIKSLGGGEETVAQWFRSFTDGQNDAKLLIIIKAFIVYVVV